MRAEVNDGDWDSVRCFVAIRLKAGTSVYDVCVVGTLLWIRYYLPYWLEREFLAMRRI